MTKQYPGAKRTLLAPLAGLFLIFSIATIAFTGPPYGIEAPEAIGPYLNGVFSATPPQNSAPAGWKTQDAFPHLSFSNILNIEAVPHSNFLSAADRYGKIWVFENYREVRSIRLIADLSDRVEIPRDGGMMGFVFHPEFGDTTSPYSREVFVSYNAAGNRMRLSRFSVQDDGLTLDPSSELIMIDQYHGEGKTHFGGNLKFGVDGFLYVPFGDAEHRMLEAQNIADNLIGGILRIDVDMDPKRSHPPRRRLPKTDPDEVSGRGYWIPNDNPFLDQDGGIFEEYFSIGHRNPWKLAVDRATGQIWVSEVGDLQRDEFNVLNGGGNYGWYMREGSLEANHTDISTFPPSSTPGELQDPVLDDRFGVVSGGVVYRGARWPWLRGLYIGYAKGIVALALDEAGKNASHETLVASNAIRLIWAFGTDHDGELYFIEGGQNKQIKTLAPIYTSNRNVPTLLSETDAFTDLQTLEPAPGLIPYTLNVPFWSDGALKTRWIAIPNDGSYDTPQEQIVFDEEDAWTYPAGTVAIKHFEMSVDYSSPTKTRRLETRFLIRGENDDFYGLTYRWNEDGTDAELLNGEFSEIIPIRRPEGIRLQPWLYPSSAQCTECHSLRAGVFLGPQTRQLNGEFYYTKTGITANQLESWNHIGLFTETLDESALPGYITSAGLDDATASLEHRARSYLDSNCAYCHQPGVVPTIRFNARLSKPLESAGIINGFAFNNLGIPSAAIVVPGDTSRSLLYLRANSLEEQVAMPKLAKARVDSAGVKLIADWILSLGADPTSSESTTLSSNLDDPLSVFPNPGSGIISLHYHLSHAEFVRIDLYDVHGRRVKSLVKKMQEPGLHKVSFDGSQLAGGVYYLRLRTGYHTVTRKIAIIR